MGLICSCASEDCQVNGCARFRRIRQGHVGEWVPPRLPDFPREGVPPRLPDFPPIYPGPATPNPPAPIGWICPVCGAANAPNVGTCSHGAGFIYRSNDSTAI